MQRLSTAFRCLSIASNVASTSRIAITRPYATAAPHNKQQPSSLSLGTLKPNAGAVHKRQRVGRGIGSGRGGTSGRGHKGQKARAGNGKPKLAFAGGQTPITRAFPKRGFKNPQKEHYVALNLWKLKEWIVEKGLLDVSRPITMRELYETRCIHSVKDGVKLLGGGADTFDVPGVNIVVSKASDKAIQAIEKNNGQVVARYENRLTLKALVDPEWFVNKGRQIPRPADPVRRRDILYYSDINKRGYLALRAAAAAEQEGNQESEDGPSVVAQDLHQQNTTSSAEQQA